MKKIIVTSKADFPRAVRQTKNSGERWAYISIECTDDLLESHIVEDNDHFLEDGPDVLNLNFDDVSEERTWTLRGVTKRAIPISAEQGADIYEFAKSHRDCNILVHCMAGQSRSQGVARALWDIFPETWCECADNRVNPCITPNITVVATIKHCYYEELYGEKHKELYEGKYEELYGKQN